MRTTLIRKYNNARREAVASLFPKHTKSQVVGHVVGLAVKGDKEHAVKIVRNATGFNTPEATQLVKSVHSKVIEWHKANVVPTTKPRSKVTNN